MSAEVPKQFRDLGGRPLLEWSLATLANAGCDPIVVVLPDDVLEHGLSVLNDRYRIGVVAGGETRQHSVANGLKEIAADRVVVHDAARPFAASELVVRVVEALRSADCATAAIPVEDALGEVDRDMLVSTLDRSRLWRLQTPQAFVTEALKTAHDAAAREGFVATHDAQLIERDGGSVAIVMGSPDNIKLTHARDFEMAEAMARARA